MKKKYNKQFFRDQGRKGYLARKRNEKIEARFSKGETVSFRTLEAVILSVRKIQGKKVYAIRTAGDLIIPAYETELEAF